MNYTTFLKMNFNHCKDLKEIEKHIDFDFEYGYGKKLIEYIK